MNTPGTVEGNWRWRFAFEDLDPGKLAAFEGLVRGSGRAPQMAEGAAAQ